MNEITGLLPHVKFHFNVQHPTLEECYVYGYECALADVIEEENPYQVNSKESEQWLEGWWAGFYGEKPLFNGDEDVARVDDMSIQAVNDGHFHNVQEIRDVRNSYFTKVLEIAGVIAVSAILGYQVIDMVA